MSNSLSALAVVVVRWIGQSSFISTIGVTPRFRLLQNTQQLFNDIHPKRGDIGTALFEKSLLLEVDLQSRQNNLRVNPSRQMSLNRSNIYRPPPVTPGSDVNFTPYNYHSMLSSYRRGLFLGVSYATAEIQAIFRRTQMKPSLSQPSIVCAKKYFDGVGDVRHLNVFLLLL